MEDDIDIEEHDLLNDPALRSVFPDLTILKSEIIDFNISAETPSEMHVLERNENQLDGTLAENSGTLPPVCPTHDTDVKPDIICMDVDGTKTVVCDKISESDIIVSQGFQLSEFYSNRIKLNSSEEQDVNGILKLDYNNIKKEDMCNDTEPDAVITINSNGKNSRRITILEKYLQVNVVLTDCYTSLLNNNCYCAQCAVLFSNTEVYSEHYTNTHTESTHSTKASDSLVTRKQIIYSHVNEFVCDTCKKIFTTKRILIQHMLIHNDDKPFECDICKKTFNQITNLKSHKLLHTGEKPYMCGNCKKSFRHSSTLKNHELIHTGEKLFQCDDCTKTFYRRSNLKSHKLVHRGEMPFQCEICTKSFKQISHLKSHKLVHTGEKPYKCGNCKKSLRHFSTLKEHELIHTGEKPFQCDICKKTFRHRGSWKNHKLIHTGEKPFQCDTCPKSFNRRDTLKKHKLLHTAAQPYGSDASEKNNVRSGKHEETTNMRYMTRRETAGCQ
ncbi:hypothetical protein JYU34_008355 [Plutella xylostella]|uniref:C2H2-type domain-containing protein n=1 Tax=Plutella xylostella TaxID=51655 RepID=A0ABQ7QPA0_PLUXY|nr:hypothetical protein JYU34_008355 [Plutella xylostella]